MSETKQCSCCRAVKPVLEFYANAAYKDRLDSYCKTCRNAANARNNPRGNAISKIAYALVGGSGRFYALPTPHRRTVRDNARMIYETRKDASELYSQIDRVFDETHPGGFIYAVVNPAWPGWVKVGMTTDPTRRLNDYQTSSPFRDYRMIAFKAVDDRRAAETELHAELEAFGRRAGEWFEVPESFVASRLA